jgi:AbrB family looped-hinge helix DNA binding protein
MQWYYSKKVMILTWSRVMTAIAKITAKGQTTIPQEIRAMLNVKPGDLIAWEPASNGSVQVRRITPIDLEYLRAVEGTLGEWAGAADEEAYRDL